jgi:hypothetical protein
MVLFAAIAHVTPVPGELMLSHLAGRLGMLVTFAFAGVAATSTGKPPASNEIETRRVGISFFRRIVLLSSLVKRLEL